MEGDGERFYLSKVVRKASLSKEHLSKGLVVKRSQVGAEEEQMQRPCGGNKLALLENRKKSYMAGQREREG